MILLHIYIAPDKPVVNIIPVYSAGTQGLLQIKAEIYEQVCYCVASVVLLKIKTISIIPHIQCTWKHYTIY